MFLTDDDGFSSLRVKLDLRHQILCMYQDNFGRIQAGYMVGDNHFSVLFFLYNLEKRGRRKPKKKDNQNAYNEQSNGKTKCDGNINKPKN